jgi:hypothetical protein
VLLTLKRRRMRIGVACFRCYRKFTIPEGSLATSPGWVSALLQSGSGTQAVPGKPYCSRINGALWLITWFVTPSLTLITTWYRPGARLASGIVFSSVI